MNINPIHINTVGLCFDVFGAWLVAWEVVRKFDGQKLEVDPHIAAADDPPYETKEYKKWEKKKYGFMKCGLICLTIGFLLQIASNYTKSENTMNPQPIQSETKEMPPPIREIVFNPVTSAKTKVIAPDIKTNTKEK